MYEQLTGIPVYYLKPSSDYQSIMVVECSFVAMHPYYGVVEIILGDKKEFVSPACMLQVPCEQCLWIVPQHGPFYPTDTYISVEDFLTSRDKLIHEYRLRTDSSYFPHRQTLIRR